MNLKLLLKKINFFPQIAIITGSGVKIFHNYKPVFEVSYRQLSGSPAHQYIIKGHEGKLKLFKVKNKNILVFSGRHHLYEGLSITDVTANIRLAYKLRTKKILITNAAGGINQKFKAGDLMLITGFINLMQPTERGILNRITQPSKKIKTKITKLIQNNFKEKVRTGIYAGMLGPTYETYSEIKFLQLLGADAVGMSTIPEMICASSLGMDFAGISIISNVWKKNHIPSHKEVVKNVNRANKKLNELILKLVNEI